jgi:hypothetical protein
MEVRILASAADAGLAFDLRCEIREKLLAYLVREHPSALPRLRMAAPREVDVRDAVAPRLSLAGDGRGD